MSDDPFVTGLISTLGALPPSVNKYNATADYLLTLIKARPPTRAQHVATWISVFFFLALTLNALAYLIVKRPVRLRNWVTINEYIILPNASNLFAICNFFYGIISITSVAFQLKLFESGPDGQWGLWIGLAGTRYVPVFWAGWFYTWATAVFCVNALRQNLQGSPRLGGPGKPTNLGRPRQRLILEAIALNSIFVTGLITVPIFYGVFFGEAGANNNAQINLSLSVVESLQRASPMYDPDTFSVVEVFSYLLPLEQINTLTVQFVAWLGRAWRASIIVLIIQLALLTPTVLVHLHLLRKIQAKKSTLGLGQTQSTTSGGWNRMKRIFTLETNEVDVLVVTITSIYGVSFLHLPFAIWALSQVYHDYNETETDWFNLLVVLVTGIGYCIVGNVIITAFLLRAIRDRWPSVTDRYSMRQRSQRKPSTGTGGQAHNLPSLDNAPFRVCLREEDSKASEATTAVE